MEADAILYMSSSVLERVAQYFGNGDKDNDCCGIVTAIDSLWLLNGA